MVRTEVVETIHRNTQHPGYGFGRGQWRYLFAASGERHFYALEIIVCVSDISGVNKKVGGFVYLFKLGDALTCGFPDAGTTDGASSIGSPKYYVLFIRIRSQKGTIILTTTHMLNMLYNNVL